MHENDDFSGSSVRTWHADIISTAPLSLAAFCTGSVLWCLPWYGPRGQFCGGALDLDHGTYMYLAGFAGVDAHHPGFFALVAARQWHARLVLLVLCFMRRVSFVVVRPVMLGILVGKTRRTVPVGISQVQFSDLVVVPSAQRQTSRPDSAALRVLTTTGTGSLRAEQIRLKEYVDRTWRIERLLLLLRGRHCRCVISSFLVLTPTACRLWLLAVAQLPVPIAIGQASGMWLGHGALAGGCGAVADMTPGRGSLFGAVCTGTRPGGSCPQGHGPHN